MSPFTRGTICTVERRLSELIGRLIRLDNRTGRTKFVNTYVISQLEIKQFSIVVRIGETGANYNKKVFTVFSRKRFPQSGNNLRDLLLTYVVN